jgi:hypothetical protein
MWWRAVQIAASAFASTACALATVACSSAECVPLCEDSLACGGPVDCEGYCADAQTLAAISSCEASYEQQLSCLAGLPSVCEDTTDCTFISVCKDPACNRTALKSISCVGPCGSELTSLSTCVASHCRRSAHEATCLNQLSRLIR